MASKWCPKCERTVTTNGVPKFCPWGCGSLEKQDILPEFKTWNELQTIIAEERKKYQERNKTLDIKVGTYGQLKLF